MSEDYLLARGAADVDRLALLNQLYGMPFMGQAWAARFMNPTVVEVEQFLGKVADEVGINRLREFCANYAGFPASLDRPEEQSSEMQDLIKTMLEYCDAARLRIVLRMLAENSEHYVAFLLE